MKKEVLLAVFLFSIVILVNGCGTNAASSGSKVPPFAAQVWVSTTGNDVTGTGSYDNPYRTIMKGLFEVGTGETVGVMNGTYTENIIWEPSFEAVTIKGQSRANTILKPNGTTRVISMESVPSSIVGATIESVTIQDGNQNGGGIWFSGSAVLHLSNVLFYNNKSLNGGEAGGLYINGGRVVADNCEFSSNAVMFSGGAIEITAGTLEATNCVFRNNISTSSAGGALYADTSSHVFLSKCLFEGNSSSSTAGAIYATGIMSLENCVFYGNSSSSSGGGAIFHYDGTMDMMNCTVATNETGSIFGGGLFTGGQSGRETNIVNCIFWGNVSTGLYDDICEQAAGTTNISYTDMSTWRTLNPLAGGVGTVEVDPGFVGFPPADVSDLDLDGTEPLVTEGGTKEGAPADDYAGDPRNNSSYVSMGAFED